MQQQKIITERGKEYLALAIPTTKELFAYGFVSPSQKSFMFRSKDPLDTSKMTGYRRIEINIELMKCRMFIKPQLHRSEEDIKVYDFDDVYTYCIKIPVKKFA